MMNDEMLLGGGVQKAESEKQKVDMLLGPVPIK